MGTPDYRSKIISKGFKSAARDIAGDIYETEGAKDTRQINAFIAHWLNVAMKTKLDSYEDACERVNKPQFTATQHNERVIFDAGVRRGGTKVGDFSNVLGAKPGFRLVATQGLGKREFKNRWRDMALSKVVSLAEEWDRRLTRSIGDCAARGGRY